MRISAIVFFLFSVSVTGFGQESEVRPVGSFRGVKTGQGIDVYLKKGDKESAKVEVTGVKLSDVVTEVAGATLKVNMRSGNYNNHHSVKVYVTYVQIEKISASSAANVFSDGIIKSGKLEISVSSAGSVELKLESESIVITAASAGKAELEGKTKSLEIEASSAGEVDAYNFESENANVSTSSGGSAKVNVTQQFTAHANSGGDIRYRGNPLKTNTDSNSGGSVKKTN